MHKENVVCVYTMEYFSAIKNEILPFVISLPWMDPRDIILCEVSQTGKGIYHMMFLLCVI